MNFLVDENVPRSLAAKIAEMGFSVQDVRDIGLTGHPDDEVMQAAIAADAIITPNSLLGAYTTVELGRSLSCPIRSR